MLAASLAVDLVALGCAALVAPFAYAAAACDAAPGLRASWRLGAALAAALPRLVVGGMLLALAAAALARLVGPPFLVALPGPAAVLVASSTARVLEERR